MVEHRDAPLGIERENSNPVGSTQRLAYHAPALRVYGSVSLLTAGGGGTLADGTMNNRAGTSDRALKQGIVRIGTHPLGICLYLFDFKPEFRERWGTGRQFGVMADEVEQIMPQAVSVGPDGYKRVDYAMLGIRRHLQ